MQGIAVGTLHTHTHIYIYTPTHVCIYTYIFPYLIVSKPQFGKYNHITSPLFL